MEQASAARAGDHGPGSQEFSRRHEQKDKQGGQVSITSGNKGSKSNLAVEEGRTAVDNTQCELSDKDDTCSMEQASAARAGDHGPGSQEFSRRHEQKDKQGGQVSITSGNKGSKSNLAVEEGRTAVDNTQCELSDKDDTCSMEQASAARAGDHGPGGASATICSQPIAIQDGNREYGREQEEQASTGRAGDHGPKKGANPKTYSGLQNQGSTCYLNTVLQILFMTDECREAVMR
ncbi:ubiquitin carboxyl-terminal hydrolase 47-like [Anguilla anguilla]|uniref:ubiquitin carboxyl-terminal hydrolase 47-like n=1 Tax=Anguilla anguilla TaxID=7936 RepID=UPI0015B0A8F4|nr:ubiquitin carboxyl-terminal hydrolase 47-like [Anguilla anguilla]